MGLVPHSLIGFMSGILCVVVEVRVLMEIHALMLMKIHGWWKTSEIEEGGCGLFS